MTIEPLTPERRRAMTREHLLDAAAVVFSRNGFHGSTLDEVAAAAGFTKGAVYSNFKNKEDLFLALVDHRVETEAAAIKLALDGPAEPVAGDQLPRIRDLIDADFSDEMGALSFEFMAYAARNPRVRARLAESQQRQHEVAKRLIAYEHERRGVQPRYPLDLLATIMLALFDGISARRFIDPSAVTVETLHQALAFLYTAIGVDDPPPDPEQ